MVFVGDLHGEFDNLETSILLNKSVYENTTIIQVGDYGIGFNQDKKEASHLTKLNEMLLDLNSKLLIVRGNHDNPSYWKLSNSIFDNIEFVKDYSKQIIDNKTVMFVGGGISLDRRRRTRNINWWQNEEIHKIDNNTDITCDILVTHVPLKSYICGLDDSILNYYINLDDSLCIDLFREQTLIEQIIKESNCKTVISGHMHKSSRVIDKTNVEHIVLNINEILIY